MPKSLSRKDNHRGMLLRNLATSLVLYEEIRTTKAKAREVKPIVERLINFTKSNSLVARRRLFAYVLDENAVRKIFEVLVPRYKNMTSGFIKVFKIPPRLGDAAEMVILRLEPAKEPVKEESAQERKAFKDIKNAKKDSQKTKDQDKDKTSQKTS